MGTRFEKCLTLRVCQYKVVFSAAVFLRAAAQGFMIGSYNFPELGIEVS